VAFDTTVSCCCCVDCGIGPLSLAQETVVVGPPAEIQFRVLEKKLYSIGGLILGEPGMNKTVSVNDWSVGETYFHMSESTCISGVATATAKDFYLVSTLKHGIGNVRHFKVGRPS